MLQRGVRNIGWMIDANDLLFTSSKGHLVEPSDFEGIKIRGLTPMFNEGLIAVGATPVNMPGSETYQALPISREAVVVRRFQQSAKSSGIRCPVPRSA